MENKYYTPEISEFHVGFEFEMSDTWGGWRKLIVTKKLLENPVVGIGSGNDRVNYYWNTRVKYLDQEDLESLGFQHVGGKLMRDVKDIYEIPYKDVRGIDDRIHLIKRPNWVLIYQGREESIWSEPTIRFSGVIKNKSELVKLLKQLGI